MHKASSGKIEILQMEETHLREVLLIEKKSFAAPWSRQLFEETLAFPLSVNLVMKMGKKIIGYINLYIIRDEAHILNVAIHPSLRRKGYASTLFNHTISFLKERRITQYLLEVREGNVGAINLYRKYGFQVIGKRKKYYTETNEDALVMQLSSGMLTDG